MLEPLGQSPAPHHRLLIDKLEAVSRGDIDRLMVMMPPGSAKSTYASVLFPAWFMAQQPSRALIMASHTSTLAEDFSKRVQRFVDEYSGDLGYSAANRAADLWYTSNQNRYLAAGVGGSVTGSRADLAIVDDPVKSREEADSQRIRDIAYNWFRADLLTRLKPGGRIVLIMCMVGDTKVSLPDGTERNLRDIRPGDSVATYENGSLAESVVEGWKSQGRDYIFEIKTESGATTRANARHPFLIERNGIQQWTKLKHIQKGDLLVRVNGGQPMQNGERGAVSNACQKDAKKKLNAKVFARRIIQKIALLGVFARRLLTRNRLGRDGLKIDTELLKQSTVDCSPIKTAFAPSVGCLRKEMFEPIGAGNFASTTTTLQGKLEGSSVTTAILRSATQKQKKQCSLRPNISDFTVEPVVSVKACGIDEVFDVQIARTENFIADGFVSHNTRWHEDDLAGRLLQDEPDRWQTVTLPAIAGDNDALGRAPGEPLWPAWQPLATLQDIRRTLGERDFAALYQQAPRPPDGALFKTALIQVVPTAIQGKSVRAWDLAATAQVGTRDPDWTAGVRMTKTAEGRFIIDDVVRLRGAPDEVEATIVATASRDGRGVEIRLPQDPGQAGKAQTLYLTRKLAGYNVHSQPVTGDKSTRAAPFASQVNVGNVAMVQAAWNRALLDEMGGFPSGAHDDQVDAASDAFSALIAPPEPAKMMRLTPMAR